MIEVHISFEIDIEFILVDDDESVYIFMDEGLFDEICIFDHFLYYEIDMIIYRDGK